MTFAHAGMAVVVAGIAGASAWTERIENVNPAARSIFYSPATQSRSTR